VVVNRQIRAMADPKITALPYVFRAALGYRGAEIKEELLEELALANMYGWAAYGIYDDILDGEGELRISPAANYFLRELCDIYGSIDGRIPGTKAAFNDFLNEIDNSNVWEQKNCRVAVVNGKMRIPDTLPHFELGTVLSERSVGHALPALVLCASVGFALDSFESKAVLEFFRHYLVARQLHDDAHDWREDLKRGQINATGAMVLRAWREERCTDEIDFLRDEKSLALFFWHCVVDDVVAVIHHHIAQARQALTSVSIINNPTSIIQNPAPLEDLLSDLASAADRALVERTIIEQFVVSYQGTNRV